LLLGGHLILYFTPYLATMLGMTDVSTVSGLRLLISLAALGGYLGDWLADRVGLA